MADKEEKKSSSTAAATAESKKLDEQKKKESSESDDSLSRDAPQRSAYGVELVVVHPLVLLSIVDHYARVAKDTSKRVVGVLLGELYRGKADVTNSYALPFEEDPKDPGVWYIDRQYHEDMFAMFKKVAAGEKIIGWYSTGPKLRPADLEINELFRSYTAEPILVIVDVNPKGELEIPTQAYVSVESRPEESSVSRRAFQHVLSEIGAYEAEEVGVEHLLRNIRDTTESSLADQVRAKLSSLKALRNRLHDINAYVARVVSGQLPIHHGILYNLQELFNLLPDLGVEQLLQAFTVNTNDNLMTIYVASLIRDICALHDLINNKLANKALEIEEGKTEAEKAAERKRKQEEEERKRKEAEEEEKKKNEKKGKRKDDF